MTMHNLTAGEDYVLKGVLMVKNVDDNGKESAGQALLDADGRAVEKTEEFTASATTQTVNITFAVDRSQLTGKTVVAYQYLYHKTPETGDKAEEGGSNQDPVAEHCEITDEDESVHFPKIWTTASDIHTNTHIGTIAGTLINLFRGDNLTAGVTDEVHYINLVPYTEYTLKGRLVDKATGETVKDADGKDVTATDSFTPKKANGTHKLSFTLDTSLIAGKSVVAFEELTVRNPDTQEDVPAAEHKDLTDPDQTVDEPGIRTTATDAATGTHTGSSAKDSVIDDEVVLTNIVPGCEYVLTGTLYDKATEKPLLNTEGKQYVTTVTFKADGSSGDPFTITATHTNAGKAESAADEENRTVEATEEKKSDYDGTTVDGNVHVRFSVDGNLLSGKTVVVFENLYLADVLITTHSDINDKGQSVSYKSTSLTPKASKTSSNGSNGRALLQSNPKTGDYMGLVQYIALAVAAWITIVRVLKKRKQ